MELDTRDEGDTLLPFQQEPAVAPPLPPQPMGLENHIQYYVLTNVIWIILLHLGL